MRIVLGFLGLAALLMLGAPHQASAAPPPRVSAYSCSDLASTIGARNVWQAWFNGSRRQLFDQIDWYMAAPCFKTQAACKAWLYWAQTDWPRQNTFKPCRKGIPY